MGEETQKFQRRTVLVKRTLQLKHAAVIFASIVMTAFIVGGDIYLAMIRIIERENPGLMPTVSAVMRMDLLKLSIFLGIMFLASLFISHRFAGPIYRFERSAQIIGTGDLTHRVSLRTGDDLVELQDEINAMVSSLQRLAQKERSLADHLSTRIDAVVKKIPDSGDKDLSALRDELKSLKTEIQHLGRSFKV